MKKKEIYRDIVDMVVEVTGIEECEILKSNREECSDARYVLVLALSKIMSDCEIGKLINKSRQGVYFIKSNDAKLKKWSVASNWKAISKRIASNYFICK